MLYHVLAFLPDVERVPAFLLAFFGGELVTCPTNPQFNFARGVHSLIPTKLNAWMRQEVHLQREEDFIKIALTVE